MGDRYWLWVGARLLVGVAIVAWAASYLGTGSGEKEFQQTLEAMKQVHSFRVVYIGGMVPTQHSETLWEVDCDRGLVHHHWHLTDETRNPSDVMNQDQINVSGRPYDHKPDGSWEPARYPVGNVSAKWVCGQLAQGTDSNVLPQIATMIKRGIIQKGDKKTVNGVRCREYLVTMKGGTSGLEHDTICIGLKDHLPYEITVDWDRSRTSISDYNTPIQFDLPEAALQTTSATN
jgi:hypothetical protein